MMARDGCCVGEPGATVGRRDGATEGATLGLYVGFVGLKHACVCCVWYGGCGAVAGRGTEGST